MTRKRELLAEIERRDRERKRWKEKAMAQEHAIEALRDELATQKQTAAARERLLQEILQREIRERVETERLAAERRDALGEKLNDMDLRLLLAEHRLREKDRRIEELLAARTNGKEKEMSYEVYEDNGGGLLLCVLEDGTCVDIFEGFEYCGDGALLDAIEALREDPNAWKLFDGSLVERLQAEGESVSGETTAEGLYEEISCDETNALVAWDEDGELRTAPRLMGAAARTALRVADEDCDNDGYLA